MSQPYTNGVQPDMPPYHGVVAIIMAVLVVGTCAGLYFRSTRKARNSVKPKPQSREKLPPPRRRNPQATSGRHQVQNGTYQVFTPLSFLVVNEENLLSSVRLEPGTFFLVWNDALFTQDGNFRIQDWQPLGRAVESGHATLVDSSQVFEEVTETLRAPIRRVQDDLNRMSARMSFDFQRDWEAIQRDFQTIQEDFRRVGLPVYRVPVIFRGDSPQVEARSVETGGTPEAKTPEKVETGKRSPSRYERLIDKDEFQ